MDKIELMAIKGFQKEFQNTFGKQLIIDWNAMNGLSDFRKPFLRNSEIVIDGDIGDIDGALSLNQILDICVERNGADINKILDRKTRLQKHELVKERNAVIDYSKIVYNNKINVRLAAELINRDRTVIYHYYKHLKKQNGNNS